MREIKFRACDNKEKIMYELGRLEMPWEYPEIEVMQFTGLHDKNGKEIYEGDIVHRTRVARGNDKQKVVRWGTPQRGGVGFNVRHCDGCIEVIGNIYENPELVGGTQKGLDLEG